MGGSHLLRVWVWNSSHAYRMNRLTASIPTSVKRYGTEGKKVDDEHHIHEAERAPSIAEEFRRVAEEKSHQASTTSHTSDKAKDGSREEPPSTSDSDVRGKIKGASRR